MNDIKDAMILSLYSLDETIAKDFLIKSSKIVFF